MPASISNVKEQRNWRGWVWSITK